MPGRWQITSVGKTTEASFPLCARHEQAMLTRERAMLTLNPGKLMAHELGLDARPNRAARFFIDLEMPMVYESQVADAVCHLVSGLLIVEGLGETSRQPRCSVAALAVTAQSISTALEDLNECSIGFWSLLPQTRTRTSEPIPRCRRPFRSGRNPAREHAVETKPRVHYVLESRRRDPLLSSMVQSGRTSWRHDKWIMFPSASQNGKSRSRRSTAPRWCLQSHGDPFSFCLSGRRSWFFQDRNSLSLHRSCGSRQVPNGERQFSSKLLTWFPRPPKPSRIGNAGKRPMDETGSETLAQVRRFLMALADRKATAASV